MVEISAGEYYSAFEMRNEAVILFFTADILAKVDFSDTFRTGG